METPKTLQPELLNLQEDGPDSEMMRAIQKGKDFEALFDHAVYKRILDWFEAQAEVCLSEMRAANAIESDRERSQRQLKWATTENLMREFEVMVQDAIHEKTTVIQIIKEQLDDRDKAVH